MKRLLVLSVFFATPEAYTCPLQGQSLNSLREHKDYLVADGADQAYPEDLFKAHENRIGEFLDCQSVGVAQIIHRPSETLYTAYYTNQDQCDGGNTYGVIVRGTKPQSLKAVATIEDSSIQCLE